MRRKVFAVVAAAGALGVTGAAMAAVINGTPGDDLLRGTEQVDQSTHSPETTPSMRAVARTTCGQDPGTTEPVPPTGTTSCTAAAGTM